MIEVQNLMNSELVGWLINDWPDKDHS
jgi:hypothetical protein